MRSAIEAGDLIADVLGPEALADDSEWAYMISFLPGLKSAGGTEEILRNTIGERVLGLPPEPRLDKGIPFSELRAKERAGGGAHEPRADRRAELPARGRPRGALAREDRRGRARGARGSGRPARPVADGARGRLGRPARERGQRRRRAERVRRDARDDRGRARARRHRAARPPARVGAARRGGRRAHRRGRRGRAARVLRRRAAAGRPRGALDGRAAVGVGAAGRAGARG